MKANMKLLWVPLIMLVLVQTCFAWGEAKSVQCDPSLRAWTSPDKKVSVVAEPANEESQLNFKFKNVKGEVYKEWLSPFNGRVLESCFFIKIKGKDFFGVQVILGAKSGQVFIFDLNNGELAHESPRSYIPVQIAVDGDRLLIEHYKSEYDPQSEEYQIKAETYHWPSK